MHSQKAKPPVWFWVVAIIFLLWNIMGLFSFFAHTFITDEALAALPENERALYDQYPVWTTIVFAIATGAGLLAALALVLRKKWARIFAVISLLAVIPQMAHNVFFTSAIEVYGMVQAVTMPILVVVFGALMIWFASAGIKKGWLK
jgi:hypothetical protein